MDKRCNILTNSFKRLIPAVAVAILVLGCVPRQVSRELTHVSQAKSINPNRKYIKVHMKDGNLYVLHSWSSNNSDKLITGLGNYLDVNRRIIETRGADGFNKAKRGHFERFEIPFDDVMLVETNDRGSNPGVAAMIVLGIANTALSVYCLANPKACFGSCPTYYVTEDSGNTLVGEGFSSSISRAFEDRDIDLIDYTPPNDTPIRITVMNEAMETHMIRYVRLLSCPRSPANRVFQEAGGEFYEVSKLAPPKIAVHQASSIADKLARHDRTEWYNLADSSNLASKEDIFLEFENPGGSPAVVINARQSLMTTYLFYHSLALMGSATSHYVAELDRGDRKLKKKIERMYDILGGIEVAVQDINGVWQEIAEVRESGPIVTETHMVALPDKLPDQVKVRLRMTQGLWRLDMVNMARIEGIVHPERLHPIALTDRTGNNEEALGTLLDTAEYTVTYPGDRFELQFPGAFDINHEYFIDSKGFYIEWMRESWLRDEDLKSAYLILNDPARYLKLVAPNYKLIEPEMEQVFWNSRYTNPNE